MWNQVRRTAMALYGLSNGSLTEQQVIAAKEHPDLSVDFGVAPPDWLILWDVVWPNMNGRDSRNANYSFTPPPSDDYAERTMVARWESGARLEMESMLFHEWSIIGKLPYQPHNSN